MDSEVGSGECIQALENKCIQKFMRIPWTAVLTSKQVYKMAGMETELLSHLKSRKLRYFRHVLTIPSNDTEASATTDPWKR